MHRKALCVLVSVLVWGAACGKRHERLMAEEEALFLRGCGGDSKCAVAKHARLLDFRRDHPDVYSNLTSGAIDGMIRGGAVLLNGATCSGNVVFLVRNRLFDWDLSMLELLQWQVYNHETIFHYAPAIEKGIVVVQDVSDFPLRRCSHRKRLLFCNRLSRLPMLADVADAARPTTACGRWHDPGVSVCSITSTSISLVLSSSASRGSLAPFGG